MLQPIKTIGWSEIMLNLSIIIPHYNTPHLLKKLLDTIPIRDDIQVIVVDDNSNKQVKSYHQLRKQYTHVCFLSNDTGKNSPGICRNIGLGFAKGHWILFADADDYFTDNFYDVVNDYFDNDFDIVFFPPTSIDFETGLISNRHITYKGLVAQYLKSGDRKGELGLKYNFHSVWSKLISLDFVNRNNIDFTGTGYGDDTLFSMELGSHADKITASDNIIYVITKQKGTLTTTNSEDIALKRMEILITRYKYLKMNLSKNDFNLLEPCLGGIVVDAIYKRYPMKLIIRMFCILKKEKVRMIRKSWFNPAYILRKIRTYDRKYDRYYYPSNSHTSE